MATRGLILPSDIDLFDFKFETTTIIFLLELLNNMYDDPNRTAGGGTRAELTGAIATEAIPAVHQPQIHNNILAT